MKTIGIGIIGTGSIAAKHVLAINELHDAELVAVCHHDPIKAAAAENVFGVPGYSDIQEFLDHPGLDVVCICTPSGVHLEPALAAAKAGKHVLIEKPLEVSLGRADELIEACESNHVKLAVIFQNRFSPDYQKLKKAVQIGGFGRLLMGNAYINWFRDSAYYGTSRWKGTLKGDGGGAFINQGIHTIDLLLDLMGDVKSVFGQIQTTLYQIEGEDLGAAVLNFENGALGNITAATSLYPGYPERLEVYGTKGSAILEAGKLIQWNIIGQPSEILSSAGSNPSGSSDPTAIGHQLHQAQWKQFIKAIQQDLTPVVDGKTARKSVELIRAIYASSKSDQLVNFPFSDPV
jgi:UDP-N-acetyl-2-amino-2-deoxyglucuronate dehydrogenase